MENLSQSEGWKKLGLVLEAVQVHDSWMIKVRRPSAGKGHIQFTVRTRVEYGQMDPHEAFVGLCETFADMPLETGEDAYRIWLSTQMLPDTDGYRSRFDELVRQRSATAKVFGMGVISDVAAIRPHSQRQKVLPTLSPGVRKNRQYPGPGVPVQAT